MQYVHMTNDSHLFRTAAQLDDDGFYPVLGNRWKRGEELYLPLYQGRMIQAVRPPCKFRARQPWRVRTTVLERTESQHLETTR